MVKTKSMTMDERIDLEACFDPVFEPPQDFLSECRAYWKHYHDRLEQGKPPVPAFYASGPDGTLYFYHGRTRIRVSEHFDRRGKPMDRLIEDVIRFSAARQAGDPAPQ